MTEQEKKNVAAILARAKEITTENKRKAVESCDFETSLRLASNEARAEAYFRERGVETP